MTNKEILVIDLGAPDSQYCEECGQKIEIMEYLAREEEYKNNLCFKCTKKEIEKQEM